MLFYLSNREYRPEDFLIPKDKRVPKCELSGDEKVLNSPIIEEAFQKILEDFTPQHNKVIFSLCTTTRPYLNSTKWKLYNKIFGKDCDLIICSNGGIIPMEYMYCYPFLDYNAPHEGDTYDELYMKIFERRLTTFLNKNKKYYDKICFVFTPGTRNYRSLEKLNIDGSKLLTDTETYRKIIEGKDLYIGFPVLRYPMASYSILKQMYEYLDIYSPYYENLVYEYKNKLNIQMTIRDIMDEVYNSMEPNRGYTMAELVKIALAKCDVYKASYIVTSVRASTINANFTSRGFGQFNKNLFYIDGKLFYKYGSLEEFENNKLKRFIKVNTLF